ncbi:hypothetical protein Tcan_00950, partial [Toxocara canis]
FFSKLDKQLFEQSQRPDTSTLPNEHSSHTDQSSTQNATVRMKSILSLNSSISFENLFGRKEHLIGNATIDANCAWCRNNERLQMIVAFKGGMFAHSTIIFLSVTP